jgi:hypothetical protein
MQSAWWRRNSNQLALFLVVSGLLVLASGIAFPDVQGVLFATYWTFVFAAALLYFLSPERRVRATVSERVHAELAANEAALVEAYDLQQDVQVYLPRNASSDGAANDPPAWLFVPRHAEYDLPTEDELGSLLVASDAEWRRGAALRPAGNGLFDEFTPVLDGEVSDSPDELAEQLADGLVEGLELADRVAPMVRSGRQRIDFEVINGLYGSTGGFDHPIQSFLAVGLAVGLDRPVLAETTGAEGDRPDCVVTCRWKASDGADDTRQVRGSRSVPLWPGGWEPKEDRTAQESENRSERTVERNGPVDR